MGVAVKLINKGLLSLCILMLVAGCSASGTARKMDNAADLAKLKKVDVKVSDTTTTVVVVLDKPITYTSVRVDDPPKFILELAGVDIAGLNEPMKVDRDPVVYITPSQPSDAKRVARLEIGLSKAADSKVIQVGDTINIVFAKKAASTAEAKIPVVAPSSTDEKALDAAGSSVGNSTPVEKIAEPAAKPKAVESQASAKTADTAPATAHISAAQTVAETKSKTSAAQVEKTEAKLPVATRVEGITCAKSGSGYIVTIAGDGAIVNSKVFMLGKDRLVVDLPDVASAKPKDNAVVGGQLLKGIRMAAHTSPDKKVRIVLDIAGEVDYEVKGNGKSLAVNIQPKGAVALAKKVEATSSKAGPLTAPSSKEAKTATVSASTTSVAATLQEPEKRVVTVTKKDESQDKDAPKKEGINIYVSKKDGKTVLSSAPIDDSTVKGQFEEKSKDYVETDSKIYTGGKISFDIQDADLDKVIKLLADVSGLNILMDPKEVTGKVTLKLDKVPWDQALDILLRIYNLDKSIEGNVLRVAPKAKFDAERKRTIQDVADLEKVKFDTDQIYTRIFKLSYNTVDDALNTKIKGFLSPRGDSQYNASTNELMVTDVKDYQGKGLDKAEAIIKNLDMPRRQIMVEARIITVDTGYSRTLGISWGLTRNSKDGRNPSMFFAGGAKGDSGTATAPAGTTPATAKPTQYALNVPTAAALAGGLAGAMSFGTLLDEINLDLTIEALESVNKASTLSAPKIVVMEGEQANIVSGKVLYILTPSATGSSTTQINANTNISVKPRISGNYILMDVTAAAGDAIEPPAGSSAAAAISTNSVTTKVMVKDGDTIVLGGMHSKGNTKNVSQVPILGRIPIIGWLFKSQTYNEPESELLIFITPKIMNQQGPQA